MREVNTPRTRACESEGTPAGTRIVCRRIQLCRSDPGATKHPARVCRPIRVARHTTELSQRNSVSSIVASTHRGSKRSCCRFCSARADRTCKVLLSCCHRAGHMGQGSGCGSGAVDDRPSHRDGASGCLDHRMDLAAAVGCSGLQPPLDRYWSVPRC